MVARIVFYPVRRGKSSHYYFRISYVRLRIIRPKLSFPGKRTRDQSITEKIKFVLNLLPAVTAPSASFLRSCELALPWASILTMAFGRKKQPEPEPVLIEDPTGWVLDNPLTQFLLLHTNEIKYMCMLGYTYLHGGCIQLVF